MKIFKAVLPAIYLWLFLDVVAFAALWAYPAAGTLFDANQFVILMPVIVLIGWWAGVLVRRAKGTIIHAAVGGFLVGLVDSIFSVILFSVVGALPVASILGVAVIEIWVTIAAAVAGSGIFYK